MQCSLKELITKTKAAFYKYFYQWNKKMKLEDFLLEIMLNIKNFISVSLITYNSNLKKLPKLQKQRKEVICEDVLTFRFVSPSRYRNLAFDKTSFNSSTEETIVERINAASPDWNLVTASNQNRYCSDEACK